MPREQLDESAGAAEEPEAGSPELSGQDASAAARPLLGVNPREPEAGSQRDTCTPVLTAAAFVTARRWRQLERPPTEGWMSKAWSVSTMKCYSALQRKC